jgi:tetratricopeptide (TPR) repeat protein
MLKRKVIFWGIITLVGLLMLLSGYLGFYGTLGRTPSWFWLWILSIAGGWVLVFWSSFKGLLRKVFGYRSSTSPETRRLTRQQMDLLWMDRPGLAILKASLANPDVAVVGSDDTLGLRDQRKGTRVQDIEWAEKVMTIAEQAAAAAERGLHATAVRLYKQALEQAPECDLYLMSIGACYARMGNPREGLPTLERAAKINPNNDRIQRNLAAIRQMLRG